MCWPRGPTCCAVSQSWLPVLPPLTLGAGLACATVVSAVAGVYPALRASRLPPTEALSAIREQRGNLPAIMGGIWHVVTL
ncbi:ABC transporter permease [Streptomyces sp. NPDC001156]